MSEQTVFEQAKRLIAELEALSQVASQQAASNPVRYYSLSCAAETASRALADALDAYEGEQDDGPSDAEMWEAWDAEDAAKEPDDSFDPYAGGVIFERDGSDW